MSYECEKNILELPFSPSLPGVNDLVMFTLPDGSTVLRYWASVSAFAAPLPDLVLTVDGLGANDPASNITTITLPGIYNGRRVRVYRGPMLYHNWARTITGIELAAGEVTIADEIFTIVNY